jgi:hypothetical protein
MKQILLPVPLILLALSGCLRDPEVHAIQESSRDEDYHRRSDSAMALLDSMAVSSPEKERVYVYSVKKEVVYVQEERPVMAMVRPYRVERDTVWIHDTVWLYR